MNAPIHPISRQVTGGYDNEDRMGVLFLHPSRHHRGDLAARKSRMGRDGDEEDVARLTELNADGLYDLFNVTTGVLVSLTDREGALISALENTISLAAGGYHYSLHK